MASIYQDPKSGIWRLQYQLNGKKKVVSLHTHEKKIALTLKKQKEIDLERGLVSDTTKKTIDEYFKEYVRDTSYRKARTNSKEYFYVRKFLTQIGKQTINSFNQDDVRSFLTKYDQLTPETYNGVFVILHRFFRLATRNNYILKNPCEGITRKKLVRHLPRFLSEDEYKTIEMVTEGTPLYPFVIVARYTGMRLGELLHLEWSDWDWPARLVRVLNKPHLGHTIKNFQIRSIPISDELRDKITPYVKADGFCFPNKDGELYNSDGPRMQMKRAFKQAGIKKEKRLRMFHVFRKTFASHLVQNNVQILKVSKWLGHSNVLVTQQHYAHLSPQYDTDIEKLSMDQLTAGPVLLPAAPLQPATSNRLTKTA